MTNVVDFASRKHLQSTQDQLNALPAAARDAVILRLLEQEVEKMIKVANLLESLRARFKERTDSLPSS